MNIDEYRVLKAQIQKDESTLDKEQPQNPSPPENQNPPTNQTENASKQNNQNQSQTEDSQTKETKIEKEQTKTPETIVLDGIGEVTIEELRKGYLRNKDYTQKTQEVSKQRKEAQEAIEFVKQIKNNPQMLQQIIQQNPQQTDPLVQKIIELEAAIYDMKIEKEIEALQNKYQDVDIVEVLEIAQAKKILNLEDAYLISKSANKPKSDVNIEEIREQIRQELLKELKADADTTRTIITPGDNGAVYEDKTPQLTEEEKKVARNMFRDVKDPYSEYLKWKNFKI